MKLSKIIALCAVIVVGIGAVQAAWAGAETRCQAYGNANDLIYCLNALKQGGIIRTGSMDHGNAQLFQTVATQQIIPPTVIPSVGRVYNYGPYAAVPIATGYVQSGYSSTTQAIATVGSIAANVMSAAAWAYNWRHGYIGASGIYGATYMANYPW